MKPLVELAEMIGNPVIAYQPERGELEALADAYLDLSDEVERTSDDISEAIRILRQLQRIHPDALEDLEEVVIQLQDDDECD